MTQYVIDTGTFPNDGTGDPLRTAFEYVNLNFNQVFNAGPVLSNIEIINNSIITTNTNGNLILNPNGIGNVIGNAHVIPDTDSIRNLGAQNLRWDTVYARYLVGDGNAISNVSVANISNGTARVDAFFNGNVTVTANGVANVAVFTVDGLVVENTITAGTFVGNVTTTNISGESVTITATGTDQSISLAPNGTGHITVNFKNIVNLAEPVNPQDAATKYYVDSVAQGLDPKASCLLATYVALPAYTYNNGASGIGATITGNAVGTLSIDSTPVTANSRVLIKNEIGSNAPYNGIYIVSNTGNSTAAFQLTRSLDFDNGAPSGEIPGAFTFIETGVVNADTGWVCTTDNPVTVGVTPIVWTQFSGAGSYTAGQGLSLIGQQFNALVDNNTTEINLNNQIAVKPGANLVAPNIGNAIGTSLSVTGAVTAATVNISGSISTTGNITGGNLLTPGRVSASADVTGGNLITSGFITATGQIISAANINGANFNTTGRISATGNVIGGNLVTANSVVSTNVLASNVISAGGNVLASNVVANGAVSAASASVTGNIESGNILNSGVVSSAGNVVGANFRTTGQITATGNLTVGNVRTSGIVTATGDIISNSNISGGNLAISGVISASGNIATNNYFVGNGAFITGISTTAGTALTNGNTDISTAFNGNANVTIAGVANVVVFASDGMYVNGLTSVTGNVTAGNVLSTGLISTSGNVDAGNVNTNRISGSDVVVTAVGNITLAPTGNISAGNVLITNLANPINLQDAATKYYVDTVATGLDPKASVVYATASALGVPYTYFNGTSGDGATLTSNLPGALSIDGNTVQAGQRVLIKNEVGAFVSNSVPSAAFNGIYDVTIPGDVGNAWVLTRSADFNQASEMASSFTFVEEGSTNADTGWVCTTNNPITVGFTQIIFTQFSGAGTYTAGNGLSLNGTVFNVNVDGNITINGNNQVSIATNATLIGPNISNATATSVSVAGNVTANLYLGNTVSVTGNITAANVFGNITGNVVGPIPASVNILYVAKNGSDTNDGTINKPFLTIKAAMAAATAGTSVHVAPGSYTEDNPITIPANVALIGDNLRSVFVTPSSPSSDLFYMRNGTYVWGITIRDYLANGFSYDPATPSQNVFVSPYIQNITSSTTTGTAVYVDGNNVSASSTKAMIVGFFTIINRGGKGIHLVNSAYSQLVNIYTIACDIGIKAESGAFCTLNGSDCSIGNYGLVADGVGPLQTSGNTVGYSTQGKFILNGLSNGQPHVNTVMKIPGDPEYYTIDIILPDIPAVGQSTVFVQQVYLANLAPSTNVEFYTRTSIIASAHTFEYVGAGTNPATALPQYGGLPIEANEVLQLNGGVVTFTSTDQKGNFKVGQGFTINQATGEITGDYFYKSLFAQMTPYILALGP